MFILINAPEGVLNDECSVCGIFRDKKDAQEAMIENVFYTLGPEIDDMDDYSIDDMHGTCYLDRPGAPEWHIFEV